MNYTSYADSIHELGLLKEKGFSEVLISHPKLSRVSYHKNFEAIAKEAKNLGLKVILVWDVLNTEQDFEKSLNVFCHLSSSLYDCVRAQDLGVIEYLLEESSSPIQLIAETGNHNLIGLKKWETYLGNRLDRMILSIELDKEKLNEYSEKLNCSLEIQVLGRILIFYSPRKLLSPISGEKTNYINHQPFLEAIGESEESPHKGFPIIENEHGTFMYHIKDLFLLDRLEDLSKMRIDFLRMEVRHKQLDELLGFFEANGKLQNFDGLKSYYGKDIIRGYFQINKSDVLFRKLKNYRIQRKDQNYIGEVVEILKGEYMAIKIKTDHEVKIGQSLNFVTPEGKNLSCQIYSLKDTSYTDQVIIGEKNLALVNYFGGIWPKTQVYLDR